MTDYTKTIIYKIQHEDNETLLYVGSTTNFTKRKYQHKKDCLKSNYKLYNMIKENGGWDKFNMIQVKEYPCENKRQAEKEENKIMMELKENLISKRPSKERKEYTAQYYIKNKDKILKQKKNYYEDNKNNIKEYVKEYRKKNHEEMLVKEKEYRVKNKEKLIQKDKKYYEANKNKIKEYYKDNKDKILEKKKNYYEDNKNKILEKVTCECGCIVNKIGLKIHKKSKKHLKLIS